MLNPINVSPINTSKELEFCCIHCGLKGTIRLENSVINTDDLGQPLNISDIEGYICPNPTCQKDLKEQIK